MSDPLRPGTTTPPTIPGLAILDAIARGGQGTVHLAHQIAHDRTVALKVLDVRTLDDATVRRFERERTALGRISDHPCVVSMLDSGFLDDGNPYLILEYAPGGSLADRLDSGPLGFDEATALAVGVASALERAHRAGVVHRDVKPGNVMASAYGEWMLTDFGIASVADAVATDTIQASYAHAAPEVFEDGELSERSDVYSLASLLATTLTGDEPFASQRGEGLASTMRRIGTEPYPDVRERGVPGDVADLLLMSLSKEPDRRPESAQAFALALNACRRARGLRDAPMYTTADVAAATVVLPDDRVRGAMVDGSEGGDAPASGTHRRRHRRSRRSASSRSARKLRPRLAAAGVSVAALAAAAGIVGAFDDVDTVLLLTDSGTASVVGDGSDDIPALDADMTDTEAEVVDPDPDPATTTIDVADGDGDGRRRPAGANGERPDRNGDGRNGPPPRDGRGDGGVGEPAV